MKMTPRFNLWLEADSEVAFSTWRAALLRQVEQLGSISAAADKMGVQYRTAWQKINEMETRLGVKLVETQVGGQRGGGAQLTRAAQEYLRKFDRFNAEVEKVIHARYDQLFNA